MIVTRGDVDVSTIVNSMPFDDVVVWDNSKRSDYQCFGRFAAVAECKHNIIYVQDDDVLVPIPALLKAYDGHGVVANRKPDEEYRFLGVGAVFHRKHVHALDKYLDKHPLDEFFFRTADVIFAELNPYRSVWLGYAEFEWSRADNRMYKQHGHYEARNVAIERAREIGGT